MGVNIRQANHSIKSLLPDGHFTTKVNDAVLAVILENLTLDIYGYCCKILNTLYYM